MTEPVIPGTRCSVREARRKLRASLPLAAVWKCANAETHRPPSQAQRALILAGAPWRVTAKSAAALWGLCLAFGRWADSAELEAIPEHAHIRAAKRDTKFQRLLRQITSKRFRKAAAH